LGDVKITGGFNTYAYVDSQPTLYVDPDGLQRVVAPTFPTYPKPIPIPLPAEPLRPPGGGNPGPSPFLDRINRANEAADGASVWTGTSSNFSHPGLPSGVEALFNPNNRNKPYVNYDNGPGNTVCFPAPPQTCPATPRCIPTIGK
jgi:hypothetical protein